MRGNGGSPNRHLFHVIDTLWGVAIEINRRNLYSRRPGPGLVIDSDEKLIIANVRILRFVAKLRRKFRVARVNIWNVTWQKRIVARTPYRSSPGNDFEKSCDMTRGRAADRTHHTVARSGGVSFLF